MHFSPLHPTTSGRVMFHIVAQFSARKSERESRRGREWEGLDFITEFFPSLNHPPTDIRRRLSKKVTNNEVENFILRRKIFLVFLFPPPRFLSLSHSSSTNSRMSQSLIRASNLWLVEGDFPNSCCRQGIVVSLCDCSRCQSSRGVEAAKKLKTFKTAFVLHARVCIFHSKGEKLDQTAMFSFRLAWRLSSDEANEKEKQ